MDNFITPGLLGSIPIILSDLACDPEYKIVKRTWKERLFEKPWQPRRKYKRVMVALNPQIYRISTISGYKIIAHTSLKEQIFSDCKS